MNGPSSGPSAGDRADERDRQRVIGSIPDTYRGYASSGRELRWRHPAPGIRLMLAERDAWLLSAIRPALSGTVVDLGCGTGSLASLLDENRARPARYVGIDLLEDRLAEARQRSPWAEFFEASADRTPLETTSADGLVASTLFSSLTESWFRARVAAEIERLLRPGGRLLVYDFRYPSPGNDRVRPISASVLRALFPGWPTEVRSLSLLPPLARTWLGATPARYRALTAIPLLRSHLAAVLIKPA